MIFFLQYHRHLESRHWRFQRAKEETQRRHAQRQNHAAIFTPTHLGSGFLTLAVSTISVPQSTRTASRLRPVAPDLSRSTRIACLPTPRSLQRHGHRQEARAIRYRGTKKKVTGRQIHLLWKITLGRECRQRKDTPCVFFITVQYDDN